MCEFRKHQTMLSPLFHTLYSPGYGQGIGNRAIQCPLTDIRHYFEGKVGHRVKLCRPGHRRGLHVLDGGICQGYDTKGSRKTDLAPIAWHINHASVRRRANSVPLAAIRASSASTWSKELPVLTTPSLNFKAYT